MAEGIDELERALAELRQAERELLEETYLRRSDGAEAVHEALRRLGEVGSPAGILARAGSELGASAGFDTVLIARVESGRLHPQTLWVAEPAPDAEATLDALRGHPVPLRYPLIEHEVAQQQRAALVTVAHSGARAAPELQRVLGWDSYVVAAIVLDGRTLGLLHAAGRGRGRHLDEVDRELAARYADGLGQAIERAVLRDQLQRQRLVLQGAARWIGAQTLALTPAPPALSEAGALTDPSRLLTARELEVMRLIARGQSNRAIATALVLGEGTVKYHVKNILRKLRARSRSEAISRFVQLTGEGAP